MSLAAETQLGPYKIISLIGAGGMGEAYRARDTRLLRDVALKLLPESFTADPDRLRRFEQEARAVAALNHSNIVSVYDVGSDGGVHYIVSEFLDGETLRQLISSSGVGMAPRKAIDLAVQLAQGLGAAHEQGIVHRDLKPENIFDLTTAYGFEVRNLQIVNGDARIDISWEEAMATTADAEIILKLYDLRREPEMRKARDYIGAEFWPESFDGLWKEIGMTGDKNRWFRQVYGYWEMAAALALYSGVDEDLFVATQIEMFYAFAKISPYVKNFRENTPDFMISVTTLCERNAKARERLAQYEAQMPLFREKIAEEREKQ